MRGSEGLRLAREGGLYTLGLFLLRAGNFLLIPLYLSLLDESAYGAFGVVRHLVNLLVPLAIVGQTHSLLTLGVHAEGDREARGALLGSITAWVLGAGVLLSALAALLWPLLGRWVQGVPLWPLGVVGLSMVTGQALFNVVLCWLQMDRRAGVHTALSLARWGLLLAGVLGFVVYGGFGVVGILGAMAIAFTGAAVLGLRVVMKGERPVLRRAALAGSLAYGLPLLPHTLSTLFFQATDQVLLAGSDSAGLDVAGVYLLATQVASAVFMFSMGMQKAWTPFFLREDRDGAGWARVRQLSFFAVAMVGVAAVVVGLAAPEIIGLAAGFSEHDWSAAAGVVPVLVLGAFVRSYYLVALAVVMANKRIARWLALVTVPSAALNVGLNLLWIPRWGMQGAAYATATSWVVVTLATGGLARASRAVPFKYGRAAALLLLVAGALGLGAGQTLGVRLGIVTGFVLAVAALDGRDMLSAMRTLRPRR